MAPFVTLGGKICARCTRAAVNAAAALSAHLLRLARMVDAYARACFLAAPPRINAP
jgi:hypothetical protein